MKTIYYALRYGWYFRHHRKLCKKELDALEARLVAYEDRRTRAVEHRVNW